LRPFDHIIKDTLKKEMLKIGVEIVTNSRVTSLAKSETDAINLNYVSDGNEGAAEYDTVLWAIGREPLLEKLNLKGTDVTLNDKGFIHVNDYQETAAAEVYALGDVCGVEQLTPGRLIVC
jgi:glutathione reductase (NADPH)